jgi:hypothetical protein
MGDIPTRLTLSRAVTVKSRQTLPMTLHANAGFARLGPTMFGSATQARLGVAGSGKASSRIAG